MHHKTSARLNNFEFKSVIIVVFEMCTQKVLGSGKPWDDPVHENQGLESTCAPHPSEISFLSPKLSKLEPQAGARHKPLET